METLRLPEPAGTLWRRCRSVIEACFGNETRDDGGFVLTGGTILAARFDHRTSTDIDVLITSCDSLTEPCWNGTGSRTESTTPPAGPIRPDECSRR